MAETQTKDGPPDALDVLRESQTAEEGSRRQQGLTRQDGSVQFPTWRYAANGDARIVASPQELEELEADGRDWQDAPHPAGTEFIPSGVRTFAAPVGAVDARGAATRADRPQPEIALTAPLPKNEAGSVPSAQAEQAKRDVERSKGRQLEDPQSARVAQLEAENAELRRKLGEQKVQQTAKKHTNAKTGVDKRQANAKKQTADARDKAKQDAKQQQIAENKAKADAQSQAVADAAKA